MLTVEVQAEILTKFFTDKRSIRSIAMEFGINRESVRRVIERRTIAMSRNTGVKESILEPYKQEITELLERDAFVTMTGVMNRIRAMVWCSRIFFRFDIACLTASSYFNQ